MSPVRPRLKFRWKANKPRRGLRVEGLEDRTVPSFAVAPNFPVGPNGGLGSKPVSIATGDFNGDGKLDVVTANEDATLISVLLGNGDGTFGPSNNISVGLNPEFVRAADVNGDGKLDLITANYGDSSVSVLLGNGDGTFQAPTTVALASGAKPVALDVGDLNGDGKPDLAVVDNGTNDISILLGDGTGNFTVGSTVAVGSGPTSVAIGDFNGDHHPDLASVSGGFGHLDVNLNTGNGTFAAAVNYATGFCASGVTVGDFNADGKLDVAVACVFPSSDGVSVLSGNGDGTFQPFVSYNDGNQTPGYITTADVNGDGLPDLVTADFSNTGQFANNSITVLPGLANGTFGPARVYYGGMAPQAVAVGDFNGDGLADVVSANDGGSVGTVAYFRGNGDGTLRASEGLPVTVRNSASWNGIAAGDFNGDGKADLAVITWNVNYNGITFFPGLGNGEFGPGVQTTPVSGGTSVVAADFNKDGKLDLAVTGDAGVIILLGNGDGTFTALPAVAAGTGAQWAAIGDFNNDGNLDLAVANTGGSNGASILLGNGDGTFQPALGVNTGQAENTIAAADLNGDGKLDLAVVGTSKASVLMGNGDGTFGPATSFNVGSATAGLAVGDLNGDGFPDLVVPSFIPPGGGGSAVLVMLNDRTGAFPSMTEYLTDDFGSNPIGATITDVDGDGIPDIVAVNDFSDTVSLFTGNGDGTFNTQTSEVVGDRPTWITTADFNGDGRNDLAVVNSNSGSVTILTRPSPTTQLLLDAPSVPQMAGDTFPVTVTARDAAGHVDPDFRGTVTFTSDDPQASLPTTNPYTFTAADGGRHTFDFTLKTAGNEHVTVTGPFGPVTAAVAVTPQAADHLKFAIAPAATAGAPLDVTVQALDPYQNIDTNFTGMVSFTTNDPGTQAVVPHDYPFTVGDAGVHTFTGGVTLVTAGTQNVSVSSGSLTGDESAVSVSPAGASRLAVNAPTGPTAGKSVDVTVTAYDPYNNVATGYTGTVHLNSSDTSAQGLGDYSFTGPDQGLITVPLTFYKAGGQSVSVGATGVTGDQDSNITVSPAGASQLGFAQQPLSTFLKTALPGAIVVQVEDPYGNPVADPVPVTLALQGGPVGVKLKGVTTVNADATGKATFTGLTLNKPATGYAFVANSSVGSSPTSDPFTVYTATHFKLVVSTKTAAAGDAFSVTVLALDGKNHPDPTYQGTVHFTSTDGPLAQLPADYTFTSADAGSHTFTNVYLTKGGGRKLTVTDTNAAKVKGKAAVTVTGGTAAKFLVTGLSKGTAGRAYAFTVKALDQFGNVATGYNGTVTFASGGESATLPAAYTFTATDKGKHAFKVTFPTAGTGLSLTVTDQNDLLITGSETGITII